MIIVILKCDTCPRMTTFQTSIDKDPLKVKGWTQMVFPPGNKMTHHCKMCSKRAKEIKSHQTKKV